MLSLCVSACCGNLRRQCSIVLQCQRGCLLYLAPDLVQAYQKLRHPVWAQMIFHSAPLLIVLLVDMAALLAYNYSGMCVTGVYYASAAGCPCMCAEPPRFFASIASERSQGCCAMFPELLLPSHLYMLLTRTPAAPEQSYNLHGEVYLRPILTALWVTCCRETCTLSFLDNPKDIQGGGQGSVPQLSPQLRAQAGWGAVFRTVLETMQSLVVWLVLQNPSQWELGFSVGSPARAGGLGAVFRTVLETMRTLFVWLVDLLLFYTPLGMGKLGESWSTYSLIQAAGWGIIALLHLTHTFPP